MDEPVPIAAAVVEHAGCVLIGPRPAGFPLAGLWEFPGGKVHPGESPADCAARECLEETGVAIRVGQLLGEAVHRYPHALVGVQFFAGTPLGSAEQPRAPFRWVPLADLPNYTFLAANSAVLSQLLHKAAKSGMIESLGFLRETLP
jgi:8-oxo-dGTP diphosphatase